MPCVPLCPTTCQVVLEYAAILPALNHYWSGYRAAQLEMETIDIKCKSIYEATSAVSKVRVCVGGGGGGQGVP